MASFLGRHLLIELYQCDRSRLDDEEFLRAAAVAAARAMRASVVAVHSHRFDPVGVSLMVVLAESHLALHTWPEHGAASADIFVCSGETEPQQAKTVLVESLRAGRAAELELERGRLDCALPPHWRTTELAAAP